MIKSLLIILILGLIGVGAWRYYQRDEHSTLGQRVDAVGERIDDARIIAVIKGKYVVDKELSVLAISVDCRDGEVKLTGSVAAAQNIARAVTLARETHGVRKVVSLLVVKN